MDTSASGRLMVREWTDLSNMWTVCGRLMVRECTEFCVFLYVRLTSGERPVFPMNLRVCLTADGTVGVGGAKISMLRCFDDSMIR